MRQQKEAGATKTTTDKTTTTTTKKKVHKKILCTRNNVEKHKFAFIVASQDLGFDPLFACLTSRPTA